jgi:photosystem I subunit 9
VPSPAASSPNPTTRSPSPLAEFQRYSNTAPVFAAIWFTVTAGILIEFNRFYPDLLFHPM